MSKDKNQSYMNPSEIMIGDIDPNCSLGSLIAAIPDNISLLQDDDDDDSVSENNTIELFLKFQDQVEEEDVEQQEAGNSTTPTLENSSHQSGAVNSRFVSTNERDSRDLLVGVESHKRLSRSSNLSIREILRESMNHKQSNEKETSTPELRSM